MRWKKLTPNLKAKMLPSHAAILSEIQQKMESSWVLKYSTGICDANNFLAIGLFLKHETFFAHLDWHYKRF